MRIPDFPVSQFAGLNTFIKDTKTVKPGIATDSMNWTTAKFGDHIELRRGMSLLGQTRVNDAGKVTGLGVGLRYDGTQIPFFSSGRKLKYYEATSDDTIEIGSDILAVAAAGEDCWFAPYQNLAGSFIYAGSPHSSIYKIPAANPESAVDQLVTDFRFGTLRFGQGRAYAGNRFGANASSSDKTGLYLSWIDKALLSDYHGTYSQIFSSSIFPNTDGTTQTYTGSFPPSVVGYILTPGGVAVSSDDDSLETFSDNSDGTLHGSSGGHGTIDYVTGALSVTYASVPPSGKTILVKWHQAFKVGDAGSTTYSGTIPLAGAQTAMYATISEEGGEILTDDRNGGLVGNLGSTGTINYATGAYSVTFNHTTAGMVYADFYTETATVEGPLDFSTDSDNARGGLTFRQDNGGPFKASLPFLGVDYAFHLLNTWATTIATDTTNLPYRVIGVSYSRSVDQTPDGLLLIDTSNLSDPKVRRLEIAANTNNTTIVPTSLSDALDLSGFAFDFAVARHWGDYDVVCLQNFTNGTANPYNSIMFVRNVYSTSWDMHGFRGSCLDILNGALIAGDSLSQNVFTLFSGFDDDGSPIDNHWQDGQLNLGTDNLKRTHFMRVQGLIQHDQQLKVSLVLDDGDPVEVFTIDGRAPYVDQGINTPIGSYTEGSKVIGGGGEATAHPYDVTFPIHTDVFQYVSVRFEAQAIGYVSVNEYVYKDIRDKGRRSLPTKTYEVASLWDFLSLPWQLAKPWRSA